MSSQIKAYYQMQIFDNNFKSIKKTRVRRARSFVRNFIRALYTFMSGLGYSGINTLGASVNFATIFYGCGNMGLDSAYPSTSSYPTRGIRLGTSTQAVALTDYKLISEIGCGTGTGEMEYYGTWQSNQQITTSGTQESSFDIEAIYNNNSGGSITIQEIGLYCGYQTLTQVEYVTCMLRDLVSGGQTVNDGEWIKVKYTIKITV